MTDRPLPDVLRRVINNPEYYQALDVSLEVQPQGSERPLAATPSSIRETDDGNYVIEAESVNFEVFVYAGWVRVAHSVSLPTRTAHYDAKETGEWTKGRVVLDD